MPNPNTPEGQLQMQQPADRRLLNVCRVFNDIQTGPNPLTPAGVAKLIAKRPEVYGVLEAWAK